ncbi:MAG: UDP-N-acetylglucosamine diphosphorylase/glucosamine-1-phosphate N-acetyltransferase [Crocinitomicaceae bacterium]|jgi:UDP-N-acetylglucosamine diphosphorylase/glucosamine-1-phosphate N-acetyltransferase
MVIRLDDGSKLMDFYPLTLTRPIGNLRMGIFTNDERWQLLLPECTIAWASEFNNSSAKFANSDKGIRVNACVIPNHDIVASLKNLASNAKLMRGDLWIATNGTGLDGTIEYDGADFTLIDQRWDLYKKNGEVLVNDFNLISAGRASRQLSSSNTLIGDPTQIFIEEGAKVEAAILNTTDGPIYIGKNAEIMEGSMVRGPFAMCENSALKMGTKIYGPTTLGPHCKVGGEVNNCIFYAYSNKGHDGFLGNSLIGEWCNLGADTNTSNLKNNYGLVKAYSYKSGIEEQTEVQFMGLTMGDHSKCGINTMFNTGTVVGVSSNVFGADFPPKFIDSFTWGSEGDKYDFDKALVSANNMMTRRGISLSDDEIAILKSIAAK